MKNCQDKKKYASSCLEKGISLMHHNDVKDSKEDRDINTIDISKASHAVL